MCLILVQAARSPWEHFSVVIQFDLEFSVGPDMNSLHHTR